MCVGALSVLSSPCYFHVLISGSTLFFFFLNESMIKASLTLSISPQAMKTITSSAHTYSNTVCTTETGLFPGTDFLQFVSHSRLRPYAHKNSTLCETLRVLQSSQDCLNVAFFKMMILNKHCRQRLTSLTSLAVTS